MICSSLTAFSPSYDGLFYCPMSTIAHRAQLMRINLWLRFWGMCANIGFIDSNQTLTIATSTPARKAERCTG